jgi:hypothetical protein
VPKEVDPNGKLIHIPIRFTSDAYRKQCLDFVVGEANRVASELSLTDELPITATNLVEYYIGPFGLNYPKREIGNITTKGFMYGVTVHDKFNYIVVANYDRKCSQCRDTGELPISHLNTNAAFQLAMKWLTDLSMDVASLNHDCKVHVAVSPYWSGLSRLGDVPQKHFAPIYFIWWTSTENEEFGGEKASVELFLPTKQLLQLKVKDTKYILRKPLLFTNLSELFPGVAPIHTNHLVAPIYMSAPPP